MKFDIIIGNPPYNNDLYLDFVQVGYQALNDDGKMVMITPAKWQAKGGRKNELFREQIVPHMKEIVYYPDCTDIFGIADPAGLTIYSVSKNDTFDVKKIKNVSNKHSALNKNKVNYNLFNDEREREMSGCLNNVGLDILNNIRNSIAAVGKSFTQFKPESMPKDKKYQCWCANKVSRVSQPPYANLWNTSDCEFLCLGTIDIVDSSSKQILTEAARGGIADDSRIIASFDDVEQCWSFRSWAYCRLTRFLLFLSLCGLTGIATGDEWWRFVPDPGAFDHPFKDRELYEKYGLTDDEIAIIESVIKERE